MVGRQRIVITLNFLLPQVRCFSFSLKNKKTIFKISISLVNNRIVTIDYQYVMLLIDK